ncbi:MAG TPA: hypothetical protein VIT88_14115 [Pyrinomonadaceae bacterium]
MKVIGILFCVCFFGAVAVTQEPTKPPPLMYFPERFDQWGDLRPIEENARLRKVALKARQDRQSIVYLFIHAGQTACIDEAKARGVRAKNYLIRRGVPSKRIVPVDAGWRKELSVQVWIWPPEPGMPAIALDGNLQQSDVTLEKNCKIKYRGISETTDRAN